MASQYEGKNEIIPPPPARNDWLQTAVRFYSRKFHFITVPVGLIVAAIHLKFGITYFGQCQMQPMIPIYMVVHAGVHLSLILLSFVGVINIRCIYSRDEEEYKTMGRIIIVVVLISTLVLLLFSLAWLIAGSVWIFGANNNGVQGTNSSDPSTYCQSDLFQAAFTLLIINLVLHGLIIIMLVARRICRKTENTIHAGIDMNTMNNRI